MERSRALALLENFVKGELKGKLSAGSFYQIDGSKICSKCRSSNRKTLYIIISDNMPVMLKCFRASCLIDHVLENPDVDVNKARPISEHELLALGFSNKEAISSILDCKNFIYKKSRKLLDSNVIVNDVNLSNEQIAYIEKRCKFKPSLSDVYKYHLVPIVNNVIEDNDIQMDDKMLSMYSRYDINNCVTFLCSGLTLSTRAISDSVYMQKSILNIIPGVSALGYTIGEEVENNHTMVMSEGVFDIINAERYIANFGGNKNGVLYIATLGFAKTLNIIEHYYYKNIDTMKNLILFMDSDKFSIVDGIKNYIYDEYALHNLIRSIDMLLGMDCFESISVCYNTKGKDCGDFSTPINMKRVDVNKVELFNKFKRKGDGKYGK